MSGYIDTEKNPIGLIGAGPMAVEYAKVLNALNQPYQVYGRGTESAAKFEAATGVKPSTGDLADQLAQHCPTRAIVAVGVQDLAQTTGILCAHGCSSLLVEKPGAIDGEECRQLLRSLEEFGDTEILIAYNRRYYPSVNKAWELIKKDGGVTSAQFRFTELAWKLAGVEKDPRVKANWLYANSTHVIDMAFYMAGWPKTLSATTSEGLSWHPAGSRFVGHGETLSNALFSYHSDWDAPGGWGVEIFTRNNRLIFQPLETLQVQELGSFQITAVDCSGNSIGEELKPGLAEMIADFVNGNSGDKLPDLNDQATHFEVYEAILNGTNYVQR